MPAPNVRADYEALASIAQQFLGEAESTHQSLRSLRQ